MHLFFLYLPHLPGFISTRTEVESDLQYVRLSVEHGYMYFLRLQSQWQDLKSICFWILIPCLDHFAFLQLFS